MTLKPDSMKSANSFPGNRHGGPNGDGGERQIAESFTHPLVKTTRAIMHEAGITPKVDPSTGDLNALIRAGHPGVTLGLTTVENLREENETIQLDPLYAGLAQLITLLQAIDGGLCEE